MPHREQPPVIEYLEPEIEPFSNQNQKLPTPITQTSSNNKNPFHRHLINSPDLMSPQQIKQPSNIAQNKRALERAAKQLEQEIPTANEKALADRLITKLPELTQRKYAVKAMPAKTVIQTFRTQVAVHEVGMDFLIGDLNNETEVDLNNAEFARYEAVKKKLFPSRMDYRRGSDQSRLDTQSYGRRNLDQRSFNGNLDRRRQRRPRTDTHLELGLILTIELP